MAREYPNMLDQLSRTIIEMLDNRVIKTESVHIVRNCQGTFEIPLELKPLKQLDAMQDISKTFPIDDAPVNRIMHSENEI